MSIADYKNELVQQRGDVEKKLTQAVISLSGDCEPDLDRLINNKVLAKTVSLFSQAHRSESEHSEEFLRERVRSFLPSARKDADDKVESLFASNYSSGDLAKFVSELKEINGQFRLMAISDAIAERLANGDSVHDVCSVGTEINQLSNDLSLLNGSSSVRVGDAMDSMITNLTKARKEGKPLGTPYHIKALCRALVGMFPSDLVLFAARPSVGKTALALNIASKSEDGVFGIFSTEMSEDQLCKRFVSMDTGITGAAMRDPSSLTDTQYEDICTAAAKFKGRNIHINDKGGITVEEIRAEVEYWVKVHGVNVILVDYLQRVKTKDRLEDVQRIGHIARTLKELAKDLKICVIALAQLNRDVAKDGRRPIMSDLRGSGEMEQEADAIILMHKPSLGTDEANSPHPIELIIAKNRHGIVGICPVTFDPVYMHYSDMTPEELSRYQETLG